jgi:hypothetical protein
MSNIIKNASGIRRITADYTVISEFAIELISWFVAASGTIP